MYSNVHLPAAYHLHTDLLFVYVYACVHMTVHVCVHVSDCVWFYVCVCVGVFID